MWNCGRTRPGDAQATSVIFLRALRETVGPNYSPEQVEAWAANYGDLDSWVVTRAAAHTQLAIIDGHMAGFTDLDDHGYIDMLFVDPDFGRHGVAPALLASVVARARQRGLPALTTFASLTSRQCSKHGFVITGERYFGEGDRAAKTYAMRCVLAGTTAPQVLGRDHQCPASGRQDVVVLVDSSGAGPCGGSFGVGAAGSVQGLVACPEGSRLRTAESSASDDRQPVPDRATPASDMVHRPDRPSGHVFALMPRAPVTPDPFR